MWIHPKDLLKQSSIIACKIASIPFSKDTDTFHYQHLKDSLHIDLGINEINFLTNIGAEVLNVLRERAKTPS